MKKGGKKKACGFSKQTMSVISDCKYDVIVAAWHKTLLVKVFYLYGK